jgi:hypothetical protein
MDMIASEKGSPSRRLAGCQISADGDIPLKPIIRRDPISNVLKQVAMKRTTFTHGNFRGRTALR